MLLFGNNIPRCGANPSQSVSSRQATSIMENSATHDPRSCGTSETDTLAGHTADVRANEAVAFCNHLSRSVLGASSNFSVHASVARENIASDMIEQRSESSRRTQ